MSTFLLRGDSPPTGPYRWIVETSNTVPTGSIPWGYLPNSGEVIYAATKTNYNRQTWPSGSVLYDRSVSLSRRALANSELGDIALKNPQWAQQGLRKVSADCLDFVATIQQKGSESDNGRLNAAVAHVLYGNATSWATVSRIPSLEIPGVSHARRILTLCSPASTTIALHDKIFAQVANEASSLHEVAGRYGIPYNAYLNKVGLNLTKTDVSRGRAKVAPAPPPSGAIGIMKHEFPGNSLGINRMRGVDVWKRDTQDRRPLHAADRNVTNNYYEGVDINNEVFGAGPSGTTRTIMSAAMTLSHLDGELLKQYVFGVIGHIVGGGHHSLHEVLSILRELDVTPYKNYRDGSLRTAEDGGGGPGSGFFPKGFWESREFASWRDRYYDVVVLGGVHWTL